MKNSEEISMGERWKFVGVSSGEKFMLQGINVWDFKWLPLGDHFIIVKDPLYKQDFKFPLYIIEDTGNRIEFAAGEFSNMVFGFYVRE